MGRPGLREWAEGLCTWVEKVGLWPPGLSSLVPLRLELSWLGSGPSLGLASSGKAGTFLWGCASRDGRCSFCSLCRADGVAWGAGRRRQELWMGPTCCPLHPLPSPPPPKSWKEEPASAAAMNSWQRLQWWLIQMNLVRGRLSSQHQLTRTHLQGSALVRRASHGSI